MENCLRVLETTPRILERAWDVEGIDVLRARVTMPEPAGGDRVARRTRRFYQLQERSFLRQMKQLNMISPKQEEAQG